MKKLLEKKIKERTAKICVVGLGYVGLPLAVEFAKNNFFVFGIDCDVQKIDWLNKGKSYIQDVDERELKGLTEEKRFYFTNDYKTINHADVVIICVPTPLRKTKEPDMSYILAAANAIKERIRRGQLIILESTTYPGTTEEVLLQLFSQNKLKVGRDFFLAFSPERIDPGNKIYKTSNIPKIVGGITKYCSSLAKLLYEQITVSVFVVSNSKAAEMAKLLENTFRAVNIALINEVALMCYKLGINVWEVIEAAKTKPFGFMVFYPGPGLGGHCLPIDPWYLSWKARLSGFEPRLIDLASQINSSMPSYVVTRIIDLVNQRFACPIKAARILIIGVTYKKNVADIRESPALEILNLLSKHKADVQYFDPYIRQLKLGDKTYRSVNLTQANLRKSLCTVIVTDHDNIDFNFILENSKLIFDTRNAYNNKKDRRIVYLSS